MGDFGLTHILPSGPGKRLGRIWRGLFVSLGEWTCWRGSRKRSSRFVDQLLLRLPSGGGGSAMEDCGHLATRKPSLSSCATHTPSPTEGRTPLLPPCAPRPVTVINERRSCSCGCCCPDSCVCVAVW